MPAGTHGVEEAATGNDVTGRTLPWMAGRLFRFACLTFLLLSVFCSCGRGGTDSPPHADTLALRHATLLTMVETDSFTLATVADPWNTGQVLHRYLLVDSGQPLPANDYGATVVRVPLRRAVAFSTVHCALLYDLGCLEALSGLCDSRYALHSGVRRALDDGRLADAGSSVAPDAERLLALRPDGLLVSPYEGGSYGALEQAGVPLIECADYAETSPLGRAEWMRFYGRLFGCAGRADSLFARVEARYDSLRHRADSLPGKPSLMVDMMYGGTWYVPAGQSTMGQLYADAGARYLFSDSRGASSVPLSFESVFARAEKADLWLIKYGQHDDLTYAQLAADYAPYTRFRPYGLRKIYGCNTSHVPFYDEVPFRPDLLLDELVSLFHPDSTHAGRYFTPLK